ncbi:MAG: glucose-6-phosphate isomerase [Sandaracinaceae bacterium]
MSAPTESAAWQALSAHAAELNSTPLRALFNDDPDRVSRMVHMLKDLRIDFSKHLATEETMRLLVALADARGVKEGIARMFAGEPINATEGRAVLHVALRDRDHHPIRAEGRNVAPMVSAVLARMRTLTDRVRSGQHLGHTGERITDIVNIGIGGSDLGPMMVCEALRPFWRDDLRAHFVSNVDGAHLGETLRHLDPARTLFIVASKSFRTIETLTNARSARAWLVEQLGDAAVSAHFVAVSSNPDAVVEFGIDRANIFEMWDWVGGRYSLWSAIGLPIALTVGMDRFEALLAGAHEMDVHFRDTPLAQNIPVLSALLGVWYTNFFGAESWAVLPYDQMLHRLPAWLQQGDMESNGKGTRLDGDRVEGYQTGPIVWGEPGTNAQHAFFQLLHQGTRLVPCDFIAPLRSQHERGPHHTMLLANLIAQAEALMVGQTEAEARATLEASGMTPEQVDALAPHKVFPGNRPSTTIVFDTLDAHALGRLLAMYEHRIFVQGLIWGLNSFDQWGVELGKVLASRIVDELGGDVRGAHDASTTALIEHVRRVRE